jgi:GT2 family glycosyltransferase
VEQDEVQTLRASLESPSRNPGPLPSVTAWTAAVINYNGGELVADTVTSIKKLEAPPDEILLVDDWSTDDSLARVRMRHPDVRIVSMPDHTGRPAAVRNEALRAATHRYVLLCDNDVHLAPDAVQHLVATMQSHVDAAVCSGVVVFEDDPHSIQMRAHPLHYLCWSTAFQERTLAEARAQGERDGIGCGTAQLVAREPAMAAGLFDENLAFGWMDDADLHHRLNLFGYRSFFVPEAVVVHRTVRTMSRVYGQVHNRWYVLFSHYQLRTLVVLAPALVCFELLLIIQVIFSSETGSYIRALRDVMAKLPQIREQRRRVQRGRRVGDKRVLSALDLDLPRHLRKKTGLVRLLRSLSLGFRWYWSMARLIL